MEITRRDISGDGGGWELGEKVQGIRHINDRYKIDGGVKSNIGNGEAKELICMMHGHELRGGMLKGIGVPGRGG